MDYAATTPVRPEVREAMEPYLAGVFGNPSSTHRWGRAAQAALEEARDRIAQALGARRREILFVRGGTESDNLAVLGSAECALSHGSTPHVVTTPMEHKAVLDAAGAVESMGGRCTRVPVNRDGEVDMDALQEALETRPCLVSIMWANNEVGTVQSMDEIVGRADRFGVPVHTDAVQAVGKLPVRLDELPVAYLSVSGHKIYGPKSTGALFVREGHELSPRLFGGGQEGGLRPGTQDVAGAVGMAAAVELAVSDQAAFAHRAAGLRDRLQDRLARAIPDLVIYAGGAGTRAPHILSVGVPQVDPELLYISLDMEGLAVSGGSACQSGSTSASHVLAAMYASGELPGAPIRFSLGRDTSAGEVDAAADITARVVARLRPDLGGRQ